MESDRFYISISVKKCHNIPRQIKGEKEKEERNFTSSYIFVVARGINTLRKPKLQS